MNDGGVFDDPEISVAHRQAQLQVPLSQAQAAAGADHVTATSDAEHLAAAAGLTRVRWLFDPQQLAEHTGQQTPPSIWGWSERATTPPTVYVDLAQCRYRGVVFAVLAHELTHLTHYGRRYSGHQGPWWIAVQELLDRAGPPSNTDGT